MRPATGWASATSCARVLASRRRSCSSKRPACTDARRTPGRTSTAFATGPRGPVQRSGPSHLNDRQDVAGRVLEPRDRRAFAAAQDADLVVLVVVPLEG